MMKKKQKQQQLVDETSIPKSIRVILATWPKQELRPVRLTQHVETLVTESRQKGIGDKQIVKWIVQYSVAGHWSNDQINAILVDYGFKTSGSGGGGGQHEFRIEDIQKLILTLTGLDESELIRADNRDNLEKESMNHVLKTVIGLQEEFDVNHWLAQFKTLGTVVDIYVDSLRDQKAKLKRSLATV